MEGTFRAENLKVFGSSLRSVVSALGPGQPLLEVPLHQTILNAAGTYFRTDDLAKLGQLCGELLRRLHFAPSMRKLVLEKSREFLAMEESAECYLRPNTSFVILLPSQCSGMKAEEASKLLTTYFLQLEIAVELLSNPEAN